MDTDVKEARKGKEHQPVNYRAATPEPGRGCRSFPSDWLDWLRRKRSQRGLTFSLIFLRT